MKGRPRKTSIEKRDIKVEVYFKEDEFSLIYERSLYTKKKLSTYLREVALKKNVYILGTDVDALIFQIGKVGVNLNQIAKNLNSMKYYGSNSQREILTINQLKDIEEAVRIVKMLSNMFTTIVNMK